MDITDDNKIGTGLNDFIAEDSLLVIPKNISEAELKKYIPLHTIFIRQVNIRMLRAYFRCCVFLIIMIPGFFSH